MDKMSSKVHCTFGLVVTYRSLYDTFKIRIKKSVSIVLLSCKTLCGVTLDG